MENMYNSAYSVYSTKGGQEIIRQSCTSNKSGAENDSVEDTITLYHYTTKEGQEGIHDSGVIFESNAYGPNDDANFGDGVYLTSIPPEDGKVEIALNNYDGSENNVQDLIDTGHVDAYVAVEMKKDDVERVDGQRDIYVYHGDLYLDDAKDVSYGDVVKWAF